MLFTLCASAPTYDAVTSTTGGVMSGNCSMASRESEMSPASVMATVIEMAKMGRRMKNSPILSLCFRYYSLSVTQLLQPLHRYALSAR